MSTTPDIEVQDLDHLGIIAGIVDEMGIVDIVNQALGTHEQEVVSSGQVVKALILNCMGFLTAPLYLFSQFFEGKATEHLIGPGVSPEHLNDSRIGRVLDKIYTYGTTQLFVRIALTIVQKFQLSVDSAHLDSSSMSVTGQYVGTCSNQQEKAPEGSVLPQSQEREEEMVPIRITHGHSKDYRPDLKQFTLDLISTADGDIPLFLRVGNGNDSDKSVFTKVIAEFRAHWKATPPQVFVADCALYTEANLIALGSTPWLSRVPLTLSLAKELVETLPDTQFVESTLPGYQVTELCTSYANVRQRWVVVTSESRQRSDLKKLERHIKQELTQQTKTLNALGAKDGFACEADALKAVRVLEKKLKYHTLAAVEIYTKPRYEGQGRPSTQTQPARYSYHVRGILVANTAAIAVYRRQAGRFILATNCLEEMGPERDANTSMDSGATTQDIGTNPTQDNPSASETSENSDSEAQSWHPSPDEILKKYKDQQVPERNFRFLKDPLFFASSVFLKSARRIVALAMIMSLSLMVYALGQRQLRRALEQADATVANQKGKPTARPTLRWILQCFQSVHVVWVNGMKSLIRLNERQVLILPFLGASSQKYYLLC